MNFIIFMTQTMQNVSLHGVYAHFDHHRASLTNLSAFTILRSVALLQSHSWKLLTSGILVALGLILVVMDAVRVFSFRRISDVVLTATVTSTRNLPKPGPMLMILYWDRRVSRLVGLSPEA